MEVDVAVGRREEGKKGRETGRESGVRYGTGGSTNTSAGSCILKDFEMRDDCPLFR